MKYKNQKIHKQIMLLDSEYDSIRDQFEIFVISKVITNIRQKLSRLTEFDLIEEIII